MAALDVRESVVDGAAEARHGLLLLGRRRRIVLNDDFLVPGQIRRLQFRGESAVAAAQCGACRQRDGRRCQRERFQCLSHFSDSFISADYEVTMHGGRAVVRLRSCPPQAAPDGKRACLG
jgi:hypothetical protein